MWLALDSATDRASVALGSGGQVLAEETIVGSRRHAADLLQAVLACLGRAGTSAAAVEGLVLADGPGSFTGLRVAAAAAKALVHARPMPLWTAPSLLALAAAAGRDDGALVLAVSNALRGELFAAGYRFLPGRVEVELAPTVITPAALTSRLPAPARVVGPAAGTLGHEPTWPEACQLLQLVGRAGGVRRVGDVAAWEPEYGRPAEAQVKWERTHGRPLADPVRGSR